MVQSTVVLFKQCLAWLKNRSLTQPLSMLPSKQIFDSIGLMGYGLFNSELRVIHNAYLDWGGYSTGCAVFGCSVPSLQLQMGLWHIWDRCLNCISCKLWLLATVRCTIQYRRRRSAGYPPTYPGPPLIGSPSELRCCHSRIMQNICHWNLYIVSLYDHLDGNCLYPYSKDSSLFLLS